MTPARLNISTASLPLRSAAPHIVLLGPPFHFDKEAQPALI